MSPLFEGDLLLSDSLHERPSNSDLSDENCHNLMNFKQLLVLWSGNILALVTEKVTAFFLVM